MWYVAWYWQTLMTAFYSQVQKNVLRTTERGAKRKSLWMDGLRLEFCAMIWQCIKEGMLFTMKFSCSAVFKLTRKWGY
jgi:hypothetical protein